MKLISIGKRNSSTGTTSQIGMLHGISPVYIVLITDDCGVTIEEIRSCAYDEALMQYGYANKHGHFNQ